MVQICSPPYLKLNTSMLSKVFITLLRSVFGKYQTCMFEILANNDSEWTDDINARAV
jgi:hypothetical protein